MKYAHLKLFFPTALLFLALPAVALAAPAASGKRCGTGSSHQESASRPGIRLELPIACALDEGWELKLTPWYEYSAIGKSPNFSVAGSGGYHEPASTNRQYGINVGLQYSF